MSWSNISSPIWQRPFTLMAFCISSIELRKVPMRIGTIFGKVAMIPFLSSRRREVVSGGLPRAGVLAAEKSSIASFMSDGPSLRFPYPPKMRLPLRGQKLWICMRKVQPCNIDYNFHHFSLSQSLANLAGALQARFKQKCTQRRTSIILHTIPAEGVLEKALKH